ncbi:MAG: acyl-CoA thioesterase [Myxococcota bacterium]|nr:acyl-CoA thioesterase [Myxococcota bacterium]
MTPEETTTTMTQMVLPQFTNNHGTVFGGQIAAWADICAAISAQRFARSGVVTVSIDELHFLKPVKQGMVLELNSMVNRAWGSSMEVGVRIEAEHPITGRRQHCCSAYLTFVSLDAEGHPNRVPTLETSGDPQWERRAQEAQARRDHRLKVREQRRKER